MVVPVTKLVLPSFVNQAFVTQELSKSTPCKVVPELYFKDELVPLTKLTPTKKGALRFQFDLIDLFCLKEFPLTLP